MHLLVLFLHDIVNSLVKRVNQCSEEKDIKRAYKKGGGPCTRAYSDRADLDEILQKIFLCEGDEAGKKM